MLAVLAACGGGGGSEPTAIPESLAVSGPSAAESGDAVRFGNSASALTGLKYSWDFGDGATSTEASPSHGFASGGEYDVVLKVTNEIGASREVHSQLSITNIANVRGLVCSGADSKGWCWQNPRPTGNRVNKVFFLDASLGWRVGDSGDIFKTTDGGVSWVKQNSGISTALLGIAFLDAQKGWATGSYGAILRTVDGGATWLVDKIGDAANFNSDTSTITPIDANTVYLGRVDNSSSYSYGTALVSTDAGATWRQITAPSVVTKNGKLWSLQGNTVRRSLDSGKTFATVLEVKLADGSTYFDSITLVASGESRAAVLATRSSYDYTAQKYFNSYLVCTTSDGGATWQTVNGKGLDSYGTSFMRLLSVSEDGTVLNALSGFNVLLRSVDGGQTWTSPSAIDPANYGVSISSMGGNAFAAFGYSGVFVSLDGGLTWPKLALPANVYSYTLTSAPLHVIDAQTFLLTDNNGNTYLTKNGGGAWTLVSAGQSYSQSLTAAFRDAKNGFMVDGKGQSFATQDGGVNWQLKRSDFGQIQSVQFVSKQVGWLVGSDGRLYKSTDGGETWLTGPVAQGVYYMNARFDSETLGWVRRNGTVASTFAATQDGGQTWADLTLPYGVVSLRLGTEAWIAVGDQGTILVSKDHGATWKSVFTGTSATLYTAAFSDAKTAWVVGSDGVLLKSADSGLTWTSVKPAGADGLRDIRFVTAQVGWIVGDNGVILSTVDGGKTWHPQSSGTTLPLASIQAVDVNTAWVSGPWGVLLATGNGGN